MDRPIVISLSGPALSLLLYESSKSKFEQIGFLLGEIIHKQTSTITDSETEEVRVVKIININSIVPCSSKYFENGRVDTDKVKKFLSHNFSEVVGWYKFQFTDSSFFVKTRLIHNQLKDIFHVPPELFTLCCMFLECTEQNSTYRFLQSFIRYNNGFINRIPVTVPNLGDENNKSFEITSKVFNNILSNMKQQVKSSKGLLAVSQLDRVVQEHTGETVERLNEYEQELFELEKEVNLLKHIKNNSTCVILHNMDVITEADSDIKENNNEVMDADINGPLQVNGFEDSASVNRSSDHGNTTNVPSIKDSVIGDADQCSKQSEQCNGPRNNKTRGRKTKK